MKWIKVKNICVIGPIIGLALGLLLISYEINTININRTENFEKSLEITKTVLTQKLSSANEILHGLAALIHKSNKINDLVFEDYILDATNRQNYIIGAYYIPINDNKTKLQKNSLIVNNFAPKTKINIQIKNLNFLKDPILFSTIQEAINTAAIIKSKNIENKAFENMFFLAKAIYQDVNEPIEIEKRQKTIKGIALVAINQTNFLTFSKVKELNNIKISIDGSESNLTSFDKLNKDLNLIWLNTGFSKLTRITTNDNKITIKAKSKPSLSIESLVSLTSIALVSLLLIICFYAIEKFIKKRKQDLIKSNSKMLEFKTLSNLAPVGIFKADSLGKIIYANEHFCELTSYTFENLKNNFWTNPIDKEYRDKMLQQWLNCTKYKAEFFEEFKISGNHDKPKWITCSATPLESNKGQLIYLGTITDITKKQETEQRLEYIAQYDELTGLANRLLFQDRLERAFLKSERTNCNISLLFLDLDEFKIINDSLGHDIGDNLLKEVAKRLTKCIRKSDTLARLGGDEFTILLDELQNPSFASITASHIIESFKVPFVINNNEIFVSTSIGIANGTAKDSNPTTLVKQADIAMYQAKENGKNTYQFFSLDSNSALSKKMKLNNFLHKAVKNKEFQLFYQPQIEIKTGIIKGIEALIRCTAKELSEISPADFIPILEDNGLIIPLSEWIIKTACLQHKKWLDENVIENDAYVSINLSARQFKKPGLIHTLQATLQETNLSPHNVVIEITEGILLDNCFETKNTLKQIKSIGIKVALDDFGTGYCSLSYLKQFPIDILKIDRSFIKDVLNDYHDAAINKAIINLCQNLNLKVIAEGVDNVDVLHYLNQLECDNYQGYYFSKPLPPEELEAILEKNKRKSA